MTDHRAHIDQIVPGIVAAIFVVATVVGVVLFIGPVQAQEAPAPSIEVPVAGVQCVGCRPVVTRALAGVEGIDDASFCCEENNVRVGATEEGFRFSAATAALEEASAEVQDEMPGTTYSIDEEALFLTSCTLVVDSLRCGGCLERVHQGIQEDEAILAALATVTRDVDGSEGRLGLEFAEPVTLSTLRAALPDHPEVSDVILSGAVCSSEATGESCGGCGGGCEEADAPSAPSEDASPSDDATPSGDAAQDEETPRRKRPSSCCAG